MLNLSIKHDQTLSKKIKNIEKAVDKKNPFTHKLTMAEKILAKLQQYGIYVALFLAGYMVAAIQNLLS